MARRSRVGAAGLNKVGAEEEQLDMNKNIVIGKRAVRALFAPCENS
ncbi:MAG: hypothetical protein IKJ89_03575 [Kiritimatiellae bacterium]|nr:hypothetical protein [Kiritimatiellia bacterium]